MDPQQSTWNGDDEPEGSAALPAFLLDPWGVLRRRWPWILLTLLVGLLATAATTYLVAPTFLAQSTILITRQQIPEEFVRTTVQEDTISNVNAMIGEVLSLENLTRMIEERDLAPADQPEASASAFVTAVRSRIEIAPVSSLSRRGRQDSIIYGISFRSEDPLEAASVANALGGLFTEASIERRSSQARRTTAFLKRQLDRDEAELREQSQRATELRRLHRGQLPTELETNMRRLEMLSQRRHSLATQVASAENRIVTLESMPQTEEKTENAILLDTLRTQLATESAVSTDAHPNVIALRERVARVEELVAAEKAAGPGSRSAGSARREVALFKAQLAETREAISELNARIDRTPAISEELAAIEQKEQVLRERYLGSLRKVEDSQLAESLESAQQGAHISILDRAGVPRSPERPRWFLGLAGSVLSLVLALGLAVLLELIDPVVISMTQLERLASGPCLGSLPYVA